MISDIWWQMWTYKVSLVPVLLTYLLFDSQAIIRRITKQYYVPIYFIVFPDGHTDKMYAEYFSEDDFYGVGQEMSTEEKAALRQKIWIYAIVSMLSATVLAPYLCGIISALYLSPQQFAEFVWFLLAVKVSLIAFSLFRLRNESRAVLHGNAFYYVVAIYVAYIYFVWRGLDKSFAWASREINTNGVWGLATAAGDLLHEEFFLNILAVSLFTYVVQQRFTLPSNISPPEWTNDDAAVG